MATTDNVFICLSNLGILTAAIMKVLIAVAAILVTVSSQGAYRPADFEYKPIPYSFNYLSATEDGGSSGHQESGDGSGTVRGSYTVNNLEGHSRVVEYEAGPGGFRAVVRTNEPGTDNSSPANVVFESTAPEAKGPVIRYNNADQPLRYNPPATSVASNTQRQNMRYVLVPNTDPRARGQ